ncbi:hypothetical protein A2962_01060 [Candidatus Woesebacteria bacterium RIFCSPLOWO2_01_FULL_39_61]|uniref:LD-carboxypeptidase n=1 Tax=Candidatus Woesebacteria bacterium RIFCSPHIGHO2_02_FULL_39_13 TaxID=1802505 RepID=A0A1F7YZI0_9BACT|nr:MAG: hypothetical protein A2692_04590 [Candidatus Woesebacteria bacterium RIFCSPHIGHO2_01_FULL_39_95]OGM32289.1 MAG: hypothetical protein A3D01_06530 [Candidatus Woesebacteria bacterium RIFCSPHIGHO2_02_FULL_39_13]OGM37057.1 MAG: hypothetical protein A3E13_00565 [Candidatus Woesebacteria bacterium RIFCSPHIGHO2_12_FULL_40_20]OGM65447.1 MAG: hypothetical protein A2962_01060 [Candidatus Woesebacteria bacterium RIFCSPLOWO2_01_FULL_39_61]OGM75188.1 MAG: hypothetical protein A3H19_06110 [Candidatus
MQVIIPSRLNFGDIIGIVAPSHPFPKDKNSDYYQHFLKGKNELLEMGFRIKESKNLKAVEWWRAGTPKERADDINSMFQDPEVKAIIAHDGGNDCITVLELLDYKLIKNNPKPFIGFSNITNLHSAFFTKSHLVGFHMGLLTYELGWVWNYLQPQDKGEGKDYFKKVLVKSEPLGLIQPITQWSSWKTGIAEGFLFGGNLSMLDSLVGTPYFPKVTDLKGALFFWELDNSHSYRIERVLTHLKYIGLFDVISGMIIGKLIDIKKTSHGNLEEPSLKEIVLHNLKDYDFPILADVDFGHKTVQIPMPLGISAKLDSDKLRLEFLESAVK